MIRTFLQGAMTTALVLCISVINSGCMTLLAGGAATGAVVANDKRTTGTVIEDQVIEGKTSEFFSSDGELAEKAHINVTSYNQRVLLTGEAPTEELRKRAGEYANRVAKVRHVFNEIALASPSMGINRTNDGLLTTKVKAKLISIKEISSTDIKVVTEAGVVYLMGLIDSTTGDAIAKQVATIGGITKVVKLFENSGS
jgi:osmotically-inducible protein OsmY